jgi:hypothetical protein
MRHLLERGVEGGIFLDPDVLVVGDLTPVFIELGLVAVYLLLALQAAREHTP